MKYELNNRQERWTVQAENANEAVRTAYGDHAGMALEVYRDGSEDVALYALIDEDGTDHRSWAPSRRGPIETEWVPVWQNQ